jgi:hypothetical protein
MTVSLLSQWSIIQSFRDAWVSDCEAIVGAPIIVLMNQKINIAVKP